jgi:hypothetical protein
MRLARIDTRAVNASHGIEIWLTNDPHGHGGVVIVLIKQNGHWVEDPTGGGSWWN